MSNSATDADESTLESEVSALLSSATLVFLGGLVSSGARLFEQLLLGRALSPERYGEVSVALAVLSLATTLSLAGFEQGVPRYLSRVETERERRGVWVGGLFVAGVLALGIAVTLVVVADEVATQLFETPAAPRLLGLFACALPFVVGVRIALGAIRGHENTLYRTYVGNLLYPGGRILVLWVLLSLGFGVFAAGYAYLCLAVVSLVAAHYFLHRLIPLVGPVETRIREMSRFSAPLVLSTLLTVLLTRTDTMMLGYFESSTAVGMYAAAYPLATGLLMVLSSVGFLYLPVASRLDANDDHDDVETIYGLTTKWIFVVTFPLFALFVVFPGDVLGVVFGSEYARAGTALSILAVGFFTNAIAGRTRETVSAFGATTVVLGVNAAIFALNVGLNLVLIPRYSFVGAAVASATANVALTASLYAVLRVKFGLAPFSAWSRRTFVVLPLAVFPPTLLASQWVTMTPLVLPVFLVGSGLACLVVVVATGCLQPEDEIVVARIEDALGRDLSWVRAYVPEADDSA